MAGSWGCWGDVGDGARDGAPWKWCESGSSIGVSRSLARIGFPVRDNLSLPLLLFPSCPSLSLSDLHVLSRSLGNREFQRTEKQSGEVVWRSVVLSTRLKAIACITRFVWLRQLFPTPPPLRRPSPGRDYTAPTTKKRGSAPYYPALSLSSPISLHRKRNRTGIRSRVKVPRKEGRVIKVWGGHSDQSRTSSANVANPSVVHTIAPRIELSSAQFPTSGQRPPRCRAAKRAAG